MIEYAPQIGFTMVLLLAEEAEPEEVIRDAVQESFEDLDEEPELASVLDEAISTLSWKPASRVLRIAVDVSNVIGDPDGQSAFATGLVTRLTNDRERVHSCICFNDWRVLEHNAELSKQIFRVEMAIREVLTTRLLEAGGNESITALFEQGTVKPLSLPNDLRDRAENELFYLLFSDYPVLNRRRKHDVLSILDAVSDHDSFDELRHALSRTDVIDSEDLASFLAELQQLMDPLERVRNAVAHNRLVRDRLQGNYEMALSTLQEVLRRELET